MSYRPILAAIGLALIALPAAAQQAGECTAFALAGDRAILMCGGTPSARSVSKALQGGVSRTINAKEVGRSYQIPAWEISGIESASSRIRGQAKAPLTMIGRRVFAVYPRGGTTVLVERP